MYWIILYFYKDVDGIFDVVCDNVYKYSCNCYRNFVMDLILLIRLVVIIIEDYNIIKLRLFLDDIWEVILLFLWFFFYWVGRFSCGKFGVENGCGGWGGWVLFYVEVWII